MSLLRVAAHISSISDCHTVAMKLCNLLMVSPYYSISSSQLYGSAAGYGSAAWFDTCLLTSYSLALSVAAAPGWGSVNLSQFTRHPPISQITHHPPKLGDSYQKGRGRSLNNRGVTLTLIIHWSGPQLFSPWLSEPTLAIWSERLAKGSYQKNTRSAGRPGIHNLQIWAF